MSRMGQEAVETNELRCGDPRCEVRAGGILRIDTGAVITAIHFEEDIELHAMQTGEVFERAERGGMIDQKIETLDLPGQRSRAIQFLGGNRNRVGDVVKPALREELRLSQCRNRDRAEAPAV